MSTNMMSMMGMENHRFNGFYSDKFSSWENQDTWPEFPSTLQQTDLTGRARSSSFPETIGGEAAREEFKRNGVDSPYNPDEGKDHNYTGVRATSPPGVYLRQKSWPAPEASPAITRPRPTQYTRQSAGYDWIASTGSQARVAEAVTAPDSITAHQLHVLASLPKPVLNYLLRAMAEGNRPPQEPARRPVEPVECRFCKRNGEEETYYRSHRLRWRGKLVCPVLRRHVCSLCGVSGDNAHTLKYCPLATEEERIRSAAMMQSVRSRRASHAPSRDVSGDYIAMGAVTPSVVSDGATVLAQPLSPLWEALINQLIRAAQ